MKFYWFTLGTLAVWRVTHLLNAEDGPWDILVRLRRRVGDGLWSGLLDCFYCLSLWISIPVAIWLGESAKERAVLWPAFSAMAILIERVTARAQQSAEAGAEYFETPEEANDVLLRQEKSGTEDAGRIH